VLFDTFHPGTRARTMSAADHLRELAAQGSIYLRRRAGERLTRHITGLSQELLLRYHLSLGRTLPHHLRELQLTRHFTEVAARHSPRRYDGPVTLFRAREVAPVYRHVGPRLGWGDLLPRLNVVEVPGTHDSMVRGPNAHVLASTLDDVLRQAVEPTRR
jgi:thioesterase domain-containing protein